MPFTFAIEVETALKQSFKYCERRRRRPLEIPTLFLLELQHCSEYAIGIAKCSDLPGGDKMYLLSSI